MESQQETRARPDQGVELTKEQRETQKRRSGLELSRRRILQEMESAHSEARRAYLEQALAFLEEELAKL